MKPSDDLPPELAPSIKQSEVMCNAFLFGLSFIVKDTRRDPGYIDNHLLSYAAQDYAQSTVSLPMLIREGIHNVCRRELRFIVELSIKLCYIQQQQYDSDIATKLTSFKKTLDSTNISIKNEINLELIAEAERSLFAEEVGRIYGETSNYVHLTHAQIVERITLVQHGSTSGREGPAEIESLNLLIRRGLACSLILLLHSVPEYVAGDLLVEPNGTSLDWYFRQSRFVAAIDEHFDYKAERQARLSEVQEARRSHLAF